MQQEQPPPIIPPEELFSPNLADEVRVIEQEPLFSAHVQSAHQKALGFSTKHRSPSILTILGKVTALRKLIICSPKQILADTIADTKIKRRANRTGAVNTISNLWDGFFNKTTWIDFTRTTNPATMILGITANLLIVIFATECFNWAAHYRKGAKTFAAGGFALLILSNLAQTVITFLGSIIVSAGTNLPERFAEKLWEEQTTTVLRSTITKLNGNLPELKTHYQEQCDQKDAAFKKLPRSHPNWDLRHNELFGEHKDIGKDRTTDDISTIPICIVPDVLNSKMLANQEKAKAPIREALEKRAEYPTTLSFLQNEVPDLFEQKFTPQMAIKNGIDQVTTAGAFLILCFKEKNYSPIIIALVINAISIITSVAGCYSLLSLVTSVEFTLATDSRRIEVGRKKLLELKQRAINETRNAF